MRIITKFLSIARIGFVGTLVFSSVLIILSSCVKKEEVEEQKREFALPVQIGKVIFIDVTDQIRAVGNVRAEQRVMITAEVEGQITEIAVEEGDKVRADDLLAQIDSREYALEVEELESELAAAQEELNKAVKGLRPEEKETLQAWVKANESTLELSIKNQNRIQKLVREGVTAQSILDEADDKVRQAQEQLRQSSAELAAAKQSRQEDIEQLKAVGEGIIKRYEMAKLDFSKTVIRAPFDGVIISKKIEQGTFVGTGSPVLEMIGSSRLKAVLEMPQSYRSKLRKLEGINFWVKELDLKFKHKGKVRVIPDADIFSGNIRMQVELPKPDRALFPGLTLEAMMNFGVRKNIMHVPSVALVISEQGTVVYVVKEGKAHLVPVRAYKERNGLVEIDDFTHQLVPDIKLILRGSGAVFPGVKVFLTNPEPETETPFNAASKQNGKDKKEPDKPET